MSVDRRLREGLRASADALTPDPLGALRTVEHKAQRQRRRILVVQLVAAAAAIALVFVALPWSLTQLRGPASVAPPAPTSVVAGQYVVDIEETTLTRTEGMAGRWIVRLAADGAGRVRATRLIPGNAGGYVVPDRRRSVAHKRFRQRRLRLGERGDARRHIPMDILQRLPDPVRTAVPPGARCGVQHAVCHDIAPFADPTAPARVAGTEIGFDAAYGRSPHLKVCDSWAVGKATGDVAKLVRSDVPVLAIIGAFGPYVRPDQAREGLGEFSNLSIVVAPTDGHNVVAKTDCMLNTRNAWVDDPAIDAAGADCLISVRVAWDLR